MTTVLEPPSSSARPGAGLGHPRLHVTTVAVPDPGPLLGLLPQTDGIAWLHGGEGMVAWGESARLDTGHAADAEAWWALLVSRSEVVSELPVAVPGSGLVAFGSFAFDPRRTTVSSGLVVPRTVVGRYRGTSWMTQIEIEDEASSGRGEDRPTRTTTSAARGPGRVRLEGGSLSGTRWRAAVSRAVETIERGQLDKVVLARDLVAVAESELDLRWVADRLVETYPQCWTYLVDGLVGSSPEMLVRLDAETVTSRVLAGTAARTGDESTDQALAAALRRSGKDLQEHGYAVASVAAALRPLTTALDVPEHPLVLELPNVLHLASDLTATTRSGVTSLGLVAALHPSAAVCGTPSRQAHRLIAELEHLDRQRYAGPVGWTDANGGGEWAIALRGGILDEHDRRRIRLFAGCGIVAASDPDQEWAESQAKLAPMLDVLGLRSEHGAATEPVPAAPHDPEESSMTALRCDERGLTTLVDRLLHAFNDADARAFADCFTPEAVWVNLYGDHMVGRAGIEAGHRQAFSSRLADAVLLPGPARIAHVRDGVHHVHQRWTLGFATPGVEGRVAARSGTMVLLGCRGADGAWSFAGGTNVADQPRG